MNRSCLQAMFASLGVAAVVSACQTGGNPVVPVPGQNFQSVSPAAANALSKYGVDATALAKIPVCKAAALHVPGIETVFIAEGNVKSATFKAMRANSIYEVAKLTKATPPPSPSSSPTPSTSPSTSPTPTPVPEYAYYGTYTLKKGHGGCAYLFATVNGKPLNKYTKDNAEAFGTPRLSVMYTHSELVAEGNLAMTIRHLSAMGGKGSFVLLNSMGGTYNSGTIELIGRVKLTF